MFGPVGTGTTLSNPWFESVTGIVVGPDVGGGPHVKRFDFDGAMRSQFMAYTPEFRGGVRVALVNVDGDGPPEIVTAIQRLETV